MSGASIDENAGATDVARAKATMVAASETFGALKNRHDEVMERLEQAIRQKIAIEFEANAIFREMMDTWVAAVKTGQNAGVPVTYEFAADRTKADSTRAAR